MVRKLLISLFLPLCLLAQVDLTKQTKGILPVTKGGTGTTSTAEARVALSVPYLRIADTAPATCVVGDVWFDSDATAGQNWYGCTAPNTWTLEGGVGDIEAVGECSTGSCFQTATANYVFAGPAVGAAVPAALRALVSADIPNNAADTSGKATTAGTADAAIALTDGDKGAFTCAGGVCTLDTSYQPEDADLTAIAGLTLVRGGLIYGSGVSPAYTMLAPGTTGQLFIMGANEPAWTTTPTWNQNTTGTAAGLTAQYIDWAAGSGGASIANKPNVMTQAVENSADNTVSVSVGTSGRAFEKTPVTIDPTTGDISTPGQLTVGAGGTTPWNHTGYTDDVPPSAPGSANQFTQFFDRTAGLPSFILYGGTQKYLALGNSSGVADSAAALSTTLTEAREPAHDGDVTNSAGDLTLTIAANAVTPAKASAVMRTRSFTLVITGSGTGGVLQDTDDQPAIWYNSLGQGVTITAVSCKTDSATASRIQLQRDDGTPANILTDNTGAGLDCSSTRAAGTLDGTEEHIASTNAIDFVMVTAGGVGKWVSVTVTYTLD